MVQDQYTLQKPCPCICEEIIKTYRSIKTYHFPFFDDNEQPTSILTWVLSIHSKITLIPYSCSPYHYSSSLVQLPFNVRIVHLNSHFWHHWKRNESKHMWVACKTFKNYGHGLHKTYTGKHKSRHTEQGTITNSIRSQKLTTWFRKNSTHNH